MQELIRKKDKIKGPINLDLTINSGQTSQMPWFKEEDSYKQLITVKNMPCLVRISENEDELIINYNSFDKINKKDVKDKINYIFNLDFDLNKLYEYLENNSKLSKTTQFCEGLRLFLANDPWEAIVSSISSANNSILRWTKSNLDMRKMFGTDYTFDNETYYSFPDITTMVELPLIGDCGRDLRACGLGYRDKYIIESAKIISSIDLNKFFKLDYLNAFKEISKLPGVGPKVADCILLYGFNFQEAFPSDVWIKRIINHLYFDEKSDLSTKKVREFGISEFNEYAGYVQLYLFHYARCSGLLDVLNNK